MLLPALSGADWYPIRTITDTSLRSIDLPSRPAACYYLTATGTCTGQHEESGPSNIRCWEEQGPLSLYWRAPTTCEGGEPITALSSFTLYTDTLDSVIEPPRYSRPAAPTLVSLSAIPRSPIQGTNMTGSLNFLDAASDAIAIAYRSPRISSEVEPLVRDHFYSASDTNIGGRIAPSGQTWSQDIVRNGVGTLTTGGVQTVDGKLRISTSSNVAVTDTGATNFVAEFDWEIAEGGGQSLTVHLRRSSADDQNFWILRQEDQNIRFNSVSSGTNTVLINDEPFPFEDDRTYRIRVEVYNNYYTLHIDEVLVHSFETSNSSSGTGFAVGASTITAPTYVDNLLIHKVTSQLGTVLAWVKVPAAELDNDQWIGGFAAPSTRNGHSLSIRVAPHGTARAQSYTGSVGEATSSNKFPENTWSPLIGVFDAVNSRRLITSSESVSGTVDVGNAFLSAFMFGNRDNGRNRKLHGHISHIAVWHRPLTLAEAVALRNGANPMTISSDALLHYWPGTTFTSGGITYAEDVIGGLHLRLFGGVTYDSTETAPVEAFSSYAGSGELVQRVERTSGDTPAIITLDTAPTEGNTLIASAYHRTSMVVYPPDSSWKLVSRAIVGDAATSGVKRASSKVWVKVAGPDEPDSYTFTSVGVVTGSSSGVAFLLEEYSGLGPLVETISSNQISGNPNLAVPVHHIGKSRFLNNPGFSIAYFNYRNDSNGISTDMSVDIPSFNVWETTNGIPEGNGYHYGVGYKQETTPGIKRAKINLVAEADRSVGTTSNLLIFARPQLPSTKGMISSEIIPKGSILDYGMVKWTAVGTTTSATFSEHEAGDTIIAFAFRDGSTTPPTLPSGWTNLANGGANTSSFRLAIRTATNGSTTSGTWTNATSVMFVAFYGSIGTGYEIDTDAGAISGVRIRGSNNSSTGKSHNRIKVLRFIGHRHNSLTSAFLSNPPFPYSYLSHVTDATDAIVAVMSPEGRPHEQPLVSWEFPSATGWYSVGIEISVPIPYVDMADETLEDWSVYGATADDMEVRKSGGTALSSVSLVGPSNHSAFLRYAGGLDPRNSWTGGTPIASTDNNVAVAYTLADLPGDGYTFTAVASRELRRLRIYHGAYRENLRLEASLSDSSATWVSRPALLARDEGDFPAYSEIWYSAASSGQTLTVTAIRDDELAGSPGNLSLSAITVKNFGEISSSDPIITGFNPAPPFTPGQSGIQVLGENFGN